MTQRIQEELTKQKYHYIISAGIRSFYISIPHFKLLGDLKKLYHDPRLIPMFEEFIKNPIEMLRSFKNAMTAIALREPLSQIFLVQFTYSRWITHSLTAISCTFSTKIILFAYAKQCGC